MKYPKLNNELGVARGFAVFLVILAHTDLLLMAIAPDYLSFSRVNRALGRIPVPLFFFASGLAFHGIISSDKRRQITSFAVRYAYLYFLWLPISLLIRHIAGFSGKPLQEGVLDILVQFVFPVKGECWFLYAMTLIVLICYSVRKIPVYTQIIAAIAVIYASRSASDIWFAHAMADGILFFMVGVHARNQALRLFSYPALSGSVMGVLGYTILLFGAWLVGNPQSVLGTTLALSLSFVGIFSAINIARVIAGSQLSHMFSIIGRNAINFYLISALITMAMLGALDNTIFLKLPNYVIVLSVSLTAIVASLAFYNATKQFRLLYEPPTSLVNWIVRSRRSRPVSAEIASGSFIENAATPSSGA